MGLKTNKAKKYSIKGLCIIETQKQIKPQGAGVNIKPFNLVQDIHIKSKKMCTMLKYPRLPYPFNTTIPKDL